MKGTFKATVQGHCLAESSKGTPSVKFKLQAHTNSVTGEKINPFTCYWDGFLTENALPNTIDALVDCFNWNGSDVSEFDNTRLVEGVEVSIVLDEELYNGETKTKVKYMNNIDHVSSVPSLDPAKAKSLSESLKGRIMAHKQSSGKKPSGPLKTAAPDTSFDPNKF